MQGFPSLFLRLLLLLLLAVWTFLHVHFYPFGVCIAMEIVAANVLLWSHFIFMTSQPSRKKLSSFGEHEHHLKWNKNNIIRSFAITRKKVTINFVENWIPLRVTPQLHHSNAVCTACLHVQITIKYRCAAANVSATFAVAFFSFSFWTFIKICIK